MNTDNIYVQRKNQVHTNQHQWNLPGEDIFSMLQLYNTQDTLYCSIFVRQYYPAKENVLLLQAFTQATESDVKNPLSFDFLEVLI